MTEHKDNPENPNPATKQSQTSSGDKPCNCGCEDKAKDTPCNCGCHDESQAKDTISNHTVWSAPEKPEYEQQQYQYIYAIGRVEFRYPTLDIRREMYRHIGLASNAVSSAIPLEKTPEFSGMIYDVLSHNLQFAQELCWVLTIGDFDTYILQPRTMRELRLLVDSVSSLHFKNEGEKQNENSEYIKWAYDLVVGREIGMSPQGMCGTMRLPVVLVDNLQTFRRSNIREHIEPSVKHIEINYQSNASETKTQMVNFINSILEDMLERVLDLTDNIGARDESRALNYVVTTDKRMYIHAVEKYVRERKRVTDIRVVHAPSIGDRRVCHVVIDYTHYETNVVEQFYVPVDVTGKWPFMQKTIQPYYGS